jgi:tetratricopeptide (TPR) repeat protein/TolB-like protein
MLHNGMNAIPESTVWRQVDRITRNLSSSPRLSAFLRHIVDAALRDSGADLKEAIVGVDVFGRAPGYDPKRDPIVRVEARRLRRKLEEYYAGIGRDDPLIVHVPTGGYAPTVIPRPTPRHERTQEGRVLVTLRFHDEDGGSEGFADSLSVDVARMLRVAPRVRVSRAAWLVDAGASRFDAQDGAGARYTLEGRIRVRGASLRVDVRLARGSGGVRWSGTFEVRVADARVVRDAIVSGVVAALGVRRPILPRAPIGGSGQPYYLCLKGRYWLPRSVERAAALFEEALAIDPSCAAAYAGLADCWSSRGIWGPESPEIARRHADACARLALEIDAELPEAHSALAMVAHGFDWDGEACAASLVRCLALDPDHADAASRFGHAYHLSLGQREQTFDWIEQAAALDPLSPQYAYDLAVACLWTRQNDRAIEEARKCLDLWPSHAKAQFIITAAHSLQGRWQEALDASERVAAIELPISLVLRGCVHAERGDLEGARQQLEALNRMNARRYIPRGYFGILHAGCGDVEMAFRELEEGCRRREAGARYGLASPFFDPLRSHARFAALLDRVGIRAIA